MDIPFEYTNNFIILTLRFQGILPLKFVFDTGAENTILTKREITDALQIPYLRTFKVAGSDLGAPQEAYLIRQIRLDIPEKAYAPMEDLLVLAEDYFKFEEYAGIAVHGILSANAFSRFNIRINYQRQIITLYERKAFKLPAGFTEYPIESYRNKLYVNTRIEIVRDSLAPVRLLLDTGAGLPLLLFSNTHPLLLPPENAIISNIGMGLGGYIEGYTGRIEKVFLDPFFQQGVVSYFQELDTTAVDWSYLHHRNGLLGNMVLSRFQLLLDYHAGKLYLKPTRHYRERFEYDRSGLNVIASGETLKHYLVLSVVSASPAQAADIRRGDEIVQIGRKRGVFLSLHGIQQAFLKKAGSRIVVTILRDGQKIKKTMVLRDLL
ncbi:MAG: PDZ domain-containing protein [Saprospiraceae bacterium]